MKKAARSSRSYVCHGFVQAWYPSLEGYSRFTHARLGLFCMRTSTRPGRCAEQVSASSGGQCVFPRRRRYEANLCKHEKDLVRMHDPSGVGAFRAASSLCCASHHRWVRADACSLHHSFLTMFTLFFYVLCIHLFESEADRGTGQCMIRKPPWAALPCSHNGRSTAKRV